MHHTTTKDYTCIKLNIKPPLRFSTGHLVPSPFSRLEYAPIVRPVYSNSRFSLSFHFEFPNFSIYSMLWKRDFKIQTTS